VVTAEEKAADRALKAQTLSRIGRGVAAARATALAASTAPTTHVGLGRLGRTDP